MLLLGLGFWSQAQTLSRSVLSSTGSTHPQLSATVGETVIHTASAGNLVLTQGFQQPDVLTGTFIDPQGGETAFLLYPNPSREALVLEVDTKNRQLLQVSFVDMQGRTVIPDQAIEARQDLSHTFEVGSLASGNYLLVLKTKEGLLLKSLRFQKVD